MKLFLFWPFQQISETPDIEVLCLFVLHYLLVHMIYSVIRSIDITLRPSIVFCLSLPLHIFIIFRETI